MMHLDRLPWSWAAAVLAAAPAFGVPSVNIAMRASFPSGPYLLELLETAAIENSSAYFPLLDRVADGYFSAVPTERELYNRFLEVLQGDGHLATPAALSSWKLTAALRAAAPRVEAHYQYYETAIEPFIDSTAEGCDVWVERAGQRFCTADLKKGMAIQYRPKNLPFDRSTGLGLAERDAILYTDMLSPSFVKFHAVLSAKAKRNEITYRVRYKRPTHGDHASSPVPVSGYGVELALKRTDYIVIDDRESPTLNSPPETDTMQVVLADVGDDNDDDFADLKPLSTSELETLGLKTASFILQSDDPFETLIWLTQDLPRFSTSLAAEVVDPDFLEEHRRNRAQLAPPGANALWMNGLRMIERQIEPYSLVGMLRRERRFVAGIQALGLSGKEAIEVLGHDTIAAAKSAADDLRFDWRDEKEEGRAIMWLNDLENDAAYEKFPTNPAALLQRSMMPGSLPPLRRNAWNLVVPLDFNKPQDLQILLQLYMFTKRALPVRFGVVPLTSSETSIEQAKMAYHLLDTYGLEVLAKYTDQSMARGATRLDSTLFYSVLEGHTPLAGRHPLAFKHGVTDKDLEARVQLARRWSMRLNANTAIAPVFVNGVPVPRNNDWMQLMGQRLTQDLAVIQQSVINGAVDEDTDIAAVLLEGAKLTRNEYIFPEDAKDVRFLDLNKMYTDHADILGRTLIMEATSGVSKEHWAALTVIANLADEDGFKLLRAALIFHQANPGVRLDVVHNPGDLEHITSMPCPIETLKAYGGKIEELDLNSFMELMNTSEAPESDSHTLNIEDFVTSIQVESSDSALILNGRIVGPFKEGDTLSESDLQVLFEFEKTQRMRPVLAAVDALGLGDKLADPLSAAKLASIVALSSTSELPEGIFGSSSSQRQNSFDLLEFKHTAIESGDKSASAIQIVALLNPASEQGQRWAPLLKVLSELEGVYVKIFLNPDNLLKALPVKRFFRYVLDSEPRFDEAGHVKSVNATFKGLPSEALLTASMDVPPAWLVAAKASVHDLDNIKLSSIKGKGDIEAMYELESILIEGHSREGMGVPRGVQLALGTDKQPHLTDTIVMANLGYFQFKVSPGFYAIRLKEGRSAEIYDIESIGAQGWRGVPGDHGTDVTLMSFQGATLYPRLARKPGKEQFDVLEATEQSGDLLSRGIKLAEGLFGRKKSVPHADINIFSVASGHLYERMLNIMMVSVMKHTTQTVKFWFIEQFLSPSFKDFIPHLAARYGFEYEMVTYKWPHWLRGQQEKQREIWGYKILFLDVLFPLSLDKVIFVDADQIVRTDMMDLVTLDLEGAPYGFTPMCDSRVEMEGFRFWKQGYWANYLRGLPYHISALYVVDLRRFRAMAAGDRLRQQYHALSADPNSLSNLDQDLPNHMQFSIPIFSLPQEWLWCETWCSDESQASARTIDLCNNPQTKEPKLDRARRQVPEWTAYDEEIAALDRRRKGTAQEEQVQVEKNTKSRRLDVDVESSTRDQQSQETEKDEL